MIFFSDILLFVLLIGIAIFLIFLFRFGLVTIKYFYLFMKLGGFSEKKTLVKKKNVK